MIEALATVGVLVGLVTALFALDRTPLGRVRRWVTRQLVTVPFSRWFRLEVSEVVQPIIDQAITDRLMAPNGGKSLHDISLAVSRLEAHLVRQDSTVVPLLRATDRAVNAPTEDDTLASQVAEIHGVLTGEIQ